MGGSKNGIDAKMGSKPPVQQAAHYFQNKKNAFEKEKKKS